MRDVAKKILMLANRGLEPVDAMFRSVDGANQGPPLFIVGAPRSGTSLTYQVVTQQLQVGYFTSAMNYLFGAPNLLMRAMKPFLGRPRPVFESAYGKISGRLAPAENGNFWFRWFPRDGAQGHYVEPGGLNPGDYADMRLTVDSMARILGRPMVFKSVYLSLAVAALARIFPDGRFLFVHRDAFFTCQSLLLARLERPHPEEWWSVKIPEYQALLSTPVWRQVTDQVFHTNLILERDLAHYAAGRYLDLRYEDLCRDPRASVERLGEWLSTAGFACYEDMRVPEIFPLSNKVRVPPGMAGEIEQRLRELNGEKRHDA
jgi:hypothetical protein